MVKVSVKEERLFIFFPNKAWICEIFSPLVERNVRKFEDFISVRQKTANKLSWHGEFQVNVVDADEFFLTR